MEFETQVAGLRNEVPAAGEPTFITERGKPVVKLAPVEGKGRSVVGYTVGEGQDRGGPRVAATSLEEWEALN